MAGKMHRVEFLLEPKQHQSLAEIACQLHGWAEKTDLVLAPVERPCLETSMMARGARR